MPIAEITAALSATGSALKLLKGINDTAKKVEINQVVLGVQGELIELNSKILAIQSEYEQLANIKAQVEAELRKEKERNEDRSQYKLVGMRGGKFAYHFEGDGGPDHYLCAVCFDHEKKSILQVTNHSSETFYDCTVNDRHGFMA